MTYLHARLGIHRRPADLPEDLTAKTSATLAILEGLSDRQRLDLGEWLLTQPAATNGTDWQFHYGSLDLRRSWWRQDDAREVAFGRHFRDVAFAWHGDDTVSEYEWDSVTDDGNPLRPREPLIDLIAFGWMLGDQTRLGVPIDPALNALADR